MSINLFNLMLGQADLPEGARSMLLQERGLTATVMKLLDDDATQALVRAKSILTLALLCRMHPALLLEACQLNMPKRFVALQSKKENRDDDYLLRCLASLQQTVVEMLPGILDEVRYAWVALSNNMAARSIAWLLARP